MEVASLEWKRLIRDGARDMGVHVSPEHIELCSIHAVELLTWARKTNLTAITDPMEIAVKHYLDSLAPVLWLSENTPCLLDVGTGGGFPGIPLKIYYKTMPATLMDASRKKTSFLKHVVRLLGLKRVDVIQKRMEEMPAARSYDIIVSRAVSNIPNFCEMAGPLLSTDGMIIAFLGKENVDDNLKLDDSRYKIEIKPYVLPYLNLRRALVFIQMR